jgi:hypothetical protein
VRLQFPQSTSDRTQDEIRQLKRPGDAIATALADTLVEAAPHALALLLGRPEMEERMKLDFQSPVTA